MGCLRLTYSEESSPLKVVHSVFETGEKGCAGLYRFGFNGQEKDDEIAGSGNSYTAEYWQYDSRLGRRWNTDPVVNHSMSPYASLGNNPIFYVDLLGDSIVKFTVNESNYIHGTKDLYVDHTIIDDIKSIIDYAVENKVHIHINSTFRTNQRQQELSGDPNAVTPAPAGNSPHNAGLAIDFNLYKDNDFAKGTISKNSTVTSSNEFITYVKSLSNWRWGGDFSTPDKVHIDKRGSDANFKTIRDANQAQMNGGSNSGIDESLVKRRLTYDPVLKTTTDNAISTKVEVKTLEAVSRKRDPLLNQSQKNELRGLLRTILQHRKY